MSTGSERSGQCSCWNLPFAAAILKQEYFFFSVVFFLFLFMFWPSFEGWGCVIVRLQYHEYFKWHAIVGALSCGIGETKFDVKSLMGYWVGEVTNSLRSTSEGTCASPALCFYDRITLNTDLLMFKRYYCQTQIWRDSLTFCICIRTMSLMSTPEMFCLNLGSVICPLRWCSEEQSVGLCWYPGTRRAHEGTWEAGTY